MGFQLWSHDGHPSHQLFSKSKVTGGENDSARISHKGKMETDIPMSRVEQESELKVAKRVIIQYKGRDATLLSSF